MTMLTNEIFSFHFTLLSSGTHSNYRKYIIYYSFYQFQNYHSLLKNLLWLFWIRKNNQIIWITRYPIKLFCSLFIIIFNIKTNKSALFHSRKIRILFKKSYLLINSIRDNKIIICTKHTIFFST